MFTFLRFGFQVPTQGGVRADLQRHGQVLVRGGQDGNLGHGVGNSRRGLGRGRGRAVG
jgi:hypothetical protein